jgi:hypothetical protein
MPVTWAASGGLITVLRLPDILFQADVAANIRQLIIERHGPTVLPTAVPPPAERVPMASLMAHSWLPPCPAD